MPDHHVEQDVLHLEHRPVAGRAVGIDLLGEEVGGRLEIVPGPLVRVLGREILAHLFLGDLGVLCLPGVVREQLVDEVLAVVHEVERQVGRHPVLLAFELHGGQHLVAEGVFRRRRQFDHVHERRVSADGVGGKEVDVEIRRPGAEVGGELVEKAVAVEEDQLDLVGVGRGRVIGFGRGAERGLFRPSRPSEYGHFGKRLRCAECREQRRRSE